MKNYKILAWPAYSNKTDNPYNYILYKSIEQKGVSVVEHKPGLSAFRFLLNPRRFWDMKIFHMHWPQTIFYGKSYRKNFSNLAVLYSFMMFLKLFGKKIVWTVHNLEPHDRKKDNLQQLLDKVLYRHVDGFISLNQVGVGLVQQQINSSQRVAYIPHVHYATYYPFRYDKATARQQLTIPQNQFVFLFLGQIRRYKNVIGLIEAFRSLPSKNKLLLIAGKVHPELENDLAEAIAGAPDIELRPGFVSDDDVPLYLSAADLVVTPYRKIFNSGSILLNLSCGRSTLAPSMGAIPELADTVGTKWVKLYTGDLASEDLANAMQEVIDSTSNGGPNGPDLTSFNPDEVAKKTIAFYESLL